MATSVTLVAIIETTIGSGNGFESSGNYDLNAVLTQGMDEHNNFMILEE